MADEHFALLTETQRSYLRLVHSGLTSKEIAQKLGGSHHTVNAEIAVAVRILGARSRGEAAAMLAAYEAGQSYDPSYDPEPVAQTTISEAPPVAGEASTEREGLSLPIPTTGRPKNRLTPRQRIIWIMVLAAAIALVTGGLITGVIAGLDGLSRRI